MATDEKNPEKNIIKHCETSLPEILFIDYQGFRKIKYCIN